MTDSEISYHHVPSVLQPDSDRILVTGSTGYIGKLLVGKLLSMGYRVRAMMRNFSQEFHELFPEAEIVLADAINKEDLDRAMEGVHVAYYLIHSLSLREEDFEYVDMHAARNFRITAEEKKVKRIIYLGGLGDKSDALSPHLRCRMKVGRELSKGSIPTTILRAAIIIGAGSASFTILKNLILKCPVLLLPPQAKTKCQPIAVNDVLEYLVGCLGNRHTLKKCFDIGGPDTVTYETMLKACALNYDKKPVFLHTRFSYIPFFAHIASYVTPIPEFLTRNLMRSCNNDVVCLDEEIRRLIPIELTPFEDSLAKARFGEKDKTLAFL
jgi:uncharacterized protein YbjT (DUF2867 family)